MSLAFSSDEEVKRRMPIFNFHRIISRKYFGNEFKISASYNYDDQSNFSARAHTGSAKIEYQVNFTLQSTRLIVLHEFAHMLQYEHSQYSKHDLAFCFINNVLIYRHFRKDEIGLKAYDIHEDLGAKRLRWSFNDFEIIIRFLNAIEDVKTMCEEAFLLANFFASTYPDGDSWDWPTITREEVAQRLGEDFPLLASYN